MWWSYQVLAIICSSRLFVKHFVSLVSLGECVVLRCQKVLLTSLCPNRNSSVKSPKFKSKLEKRDRSRIQCLDFDLNFQGLPIVTAGLVVFMMHTFQTEKLSRRAWYKEKILNRFNWKTGGGEEGTRQGKHVYSDSRACHSAVLKRIVSSILLNNCRGWVLYFTNWSLNLWGQSLCVPWCDLTRPGGEILKSAPCLLSDETPS